MKSRNPSLIRAAGALWVLAFLIWLPLEDTVTWMALALGASGSIWLGLRWVVSRRQPIAWLQMLAVGSLLGAAAPLLAIVLMAVKSGLHAHGFGDFTERQLWGAVNLIPIAAALGAIVGVLAGSSFRKSIY